MTGSLVPKTFQIPQNLRTEKFQFEILELSFAAEARFQISLEASDEIRILFRENHHPDIIDNELPAKMNLSDKTVWRRASTNKAIVFEPRESSYGKAISDKPSDQRFT